MGNITNEMDGITTVHSDWIHLKVQTMETWTVANQEALSNFYGLDLERNILPQQHNLEEVPKAEVSRYLSMQSTRQRRRARFRLSIATDKIVQADQLILHTNFLVSHILFAGGDAATLRLENRCRTSSDPDHRY